MEKIGQHHLGWVASFCNVESVLLLRLPALQVEVVACSDLYARKEYIYGMCRAPTCTEVIISAFILNMQLTIVVSFRKNRTRVQEHCIPRYCKSVVSYGLDISSDLPKIGQ
jgi:hypothetical protein